MDAFLLEPVQRHFVGGAMDTGIGYGGIPFRQLLGEIDDIDKLPAWQEVTFDILDPGFHLALGLGPVGPAYTGFKTPVFGKGLEGRVPYHPAMGIGVAHGARAVI